MNIEGKYFKVMNRMMLLYLIGIIAILLLAGCASNPPDPNRAGCYKIDGKVRYGTFTQYVKGEAKGVHVYIGEKLVGKIKITCNMIKQEILYKSESPYEDLPEWIEEEDVSISTH